MRILDINDKEMESYDPEKGYVKQETIVLVHHDAIPFQPAEYEDVLVEEYDNGSKLYEHRIKTPEVRAEDAYDETEDILRYTDYTEEELTKRAEEKAKREQEEKERAEAEAKRAEEEAKRAQEEAAKQAVFDALPDRVTAVETSNLDQDEAIVDMAQQISQTQLDTDEAITSLYEMLSTSTDETVSE